MGHDEYVVQQLDEITRERRYMTPQELQRLFKGFLRRVIGGRNQLRRDPLHEGVSLLTVNAGFIELVRKSGVRMTPQLEALLSQLEAGSSVRVTFDPDAAYRAQAEFLNIRHPFIEAVVKSYDQDLRLHRAGMIQLPAVRPSDYLFFIWLLHSTGLVPRSELVAVAVDMSTQDVDEEVSAEILPAIAQDDIGPPEKHPPLLPEVVNPCYEASAAWVDVERRKLQEELQRTNEALVVARQESLKQSRDVRVARIAELLHNATNERIRKMRAGQIRNLEARIQGKVDELESKRNVSVSVKVLAGGYAAGGSP